MVTPATIQEENDSYNAKCEYEKEENCKTNDEGAEHAASQVAINNIEGECHPKKIAANNERKVPNKVDVNIGTWLDSDLEVL